MEPEKIATRLGIEDPSPGQLERIEDAIRDAQADVQGYLNRDLFAVEAVQAELWPALGIDPMHWKAWPDAAALYDDNLTVVSAVANPNGTYNVTFKVGLDGPNDPRVVRFVTASAVQAILNDANAGMGKRQVTSVSAEGQSISYSDGSVAEGAAGALPSLKSLDRLRRRAVFRAPRRAVSVWPLTGVGYNDGRGRHAGEHDGARSARTSSARVRAEEGVTAHGCPPAERAPDRAEARARRAHEVRARRPRLPRGQCCRAR